MAKVEWKSFDVVSVGKILAVIWAIIGFFYGLMFASVASFVPELAGFGIASIVIMPIMFAIMGFIGGIICAFIYNIVAGKVGGIVVNT